MTIEEALAELETALDAKLQVLVSEIRRVIVDLPFLLDRNVPKSSIDGIHFEYDWPSFFPVACPLNISTGYCGSCEPLILLSEHEIQLVPASLKEDVIQATSEADRYQIRDKLDDAMTELYCRWFADGWRLARVANPRMRGFLSDHDSVWRTDLDTGEEFREDLGPIRFFPRDPQ